MHALELHPCLNLTSHRQTTKQLPALPQNETLGTETHHLKKRPHPVRLSVTVRIVDSSATGHRRPWNVNADAAQHPHRATRQALPSTDQRECERPSRLAPRGAPVQAFAGADGHTHPSSAALPLCLHPPRCRASSSSRKAPRRASVPPTPPPRCWAASAPCPRARASISGTAATASSACWRTGSATGAAACTSGTARCWPPSSRPRPRPRTTTMTTMAMAATGGSTTTAL